MWDFLDSAEKILIVGGIAALILAGAAPKSLPFGINIDWTANGRRFLAGAGLVCLVLSFPPLRNLKLEKPNNDSEALAAEYQRYVIRTMKGDIMPLVEDGREQVQHAAENSSDAATCSSRAADAVKTMNTLVKHLNDFSRGIYDIKVPPAA